MLHAQNLKFISDHELGVTELSREIFAELGYSLNMEPKIWRKRYQETFTDAAQFEISELEKIEHALDKFMFLSRFKNEPLLEAMNSAFTSKKVRLEKIGSSATGPVRSSDGSSWFSKASKLVNQKMAEPGLLTAAVEIDNLQLRDAPLLIAFAGAAELAPTLSWLRWGGRVLVLARRGNPIWKDLIAQAKVTGELIAPVENGLTGELAEIAGFDLVEQADLAAAAIGHLAPGERVIFGNYAYAPGFKHVELQAIAEALTRIAKQRFRSVLLHWLATPSDSAVVPLDYAKQREFEFANRSLSRKLWDSVWQLFGFLKPPGYKTIASEPELVVLDASVNLQGPSYSLAKRLQRWRAGLEANSGNPVCYQITPPATTDSVLSHKILRFTYLGQGRYGVGHVSAADGSQWPAALLALRSSKPEVARVPHFYLDTAIHGGLWRTCYETATIWIPTTIRGILRFWAWKDPRK